VWGVRRWGRAYDGVDGPGLGRQRMTRQALRHQGRANSSELRAGVTGDGPVTGRMERGQEALGLVSYPVFMPKPSTHRTHDPGSTVPHIRPKVLTDNQMS
jgi:hypothetical protein